MKINFQFHVFAIWSISASILYKIAWKAPASIWSPSELAMFPKIDPQCFGPYSKFHDPDYLSVSSNHVFRKFVKSSSKFVISLVFGGQLKLFKHEILGYVFIVSLFFEGLPSHSLHKFSFFLLIAIYNFVWIIFGCSSLKSFLRWLCWIQVECSTAKEHTLLIFSSIIWYSALNQLKKRWKTMLWILLV